VSITVVYSASASYSWAKFDDFNYMMGKHASKIFMGIIMLFLGILVNYRLYLKISRYMLIATIVLLVATLLMGAVTKGATRWISVAGFTVQPSEFAKIALLFHLASILAQGETLIRDLKQGFLPAVGWIIGVAGLVFLQPNFSTGIMILIISFTLLFIGRAKMKHILVTLGAAVPVVLAYLMTKPNQFGRLVNFFSSHGMQPDKNHQVLQGIIGFGSGGILGVGPGESKQRDFFLPESYGDFVFSIVGEEYGFIGTFLFIAIFAVILFRGFRIAKHAPDSFGRVMALGITFTVTLYAFVNAGVTLGLLPTTGLPMPFVSYGGSNLLATAFAVGVLLNISRYTELHPRIEKISPEDLVVQSSNKKFESRRMY